MNPDHIRLAFETWAQEKGFNLTREGIVFDAYVDHDTYHAWRYYQAGYIDGHKEPKE